MKGKDAPVFLDAEITWYGDPAFDAAFCLNHLLLKSVYNPETAKLYLNIFHHLSESYFNEVDWEKRESLETRVARLLPVLFLARIDGKSPAEYLTSENHKNMVRQTARKLIIDSPKTLKEIAEMIGNNK